MSAQLTVIEGANTLMACDYEDAFRWLVMTQMERQTLGKVVRFEVFKRDGFTCVYCGGQPPSVTLHCDHVIAVAKGGTNDIDNLVTACDACNMGKGARALTSIPLTIEEKAAILREREEQIRAFNHIIAQKLERIENEMWAVANVLLEHWGEDSIRKDWLLSIRRFLELLLLDEVMDAAQLAMRRRLFSKNACFRYFCGICWRKIRRARGEVIEPEGDDQ